MQSKSILDHPKYLILLFTAVFLTCLVLFKSFLVGNKLFLFRDIGSDTFYSYYRFYYFLAEQIHNLEFSFWSFKMGVGTSVLTLYAFLYDPFSLVYFIAGPENVSFLLVYVYILKIILSALFTYFYFTYIKVGAIPAVICSFLFAFNGYLMLWGQHYFFSSSVVFLPLLLLALERFMSEGKWLLLLSTKALLLLNIYFFYQIFIFVITYYLFRFYFDYGFDMKFFLRTTGKFIIIFFLAVGLVAVFIFPEYHLLKSSPRTSTEGIMSIFRMQFLFNSYDYYFSIFSRLFSNNLQGIGSSYIGFLNYYESMQLYCGLLFLVTFPQAFILFDRKRKIVISVGIFIVLVFLIFPFFARIMNGFQYATYRWGYNIIFVELILLASMLKEIFEKREVNYKLLITTIFILLISLVFINHRYANELAIYQYNVIKTWKSIAFILVYGAVLFFLTKNVFTKYVALAILIMTLSVEMVSEHSDTFGKRNVLTKGMEADKEALLNNQEIDLFGYTNDVIKYLESIDDTFFRVEKNRWISSMNDSVVQDYMGMDSYNSLNTPSYFEFIDTLNIPPVPNAPANLRMNILGWTSLQRPDLANLLSVKYHLTKTEEVIPETSKFLKTIGDIHVFKRTEALPFGFVYDKYLDREKYFSMENITERDNLLQFGFLPSIDQNMELISEKFDGLTCSATEFDPCPSRRLNVMKMTKFSDDDISGNINLEADGMLFLSIPKDSGWHATVNNEAVDIYKINAGFSGLLLGKGQHIIDLKYFPPLLKEGLIITILTILILIFWSSKIIVIPRRTI